VFGVALGRQISAQPIAIEPAAISASPPITISRVELTAPERPAASANGTVNPSAMPITTSRTNSPAVKCFSTWGVMGILRSDLRMRFEIFLRLAHHLPLAVIGELAMRIFERQPQRAPHLDAHFRCDIVDAPRHIAQQVKADDLEDSLPIAQERMYT